MSKFSRYWSMQLQLDKQSFIDAFYQVVVKNDRLVLVRGWRPQKIGEDFFGIVYKESFHIFKRKGLFEPPSPDLDGKMIDRQDGLILELRLLNNFRNTYLGLILRAIPCAFICWIAILQLFLLIWPKSGGFSITFVSIAISLLFIIIIWVQLKIIHNHLDRLKNLYSNVLKEIEKQAHQNRFR